MIYKNKSKYKNKMRVYVYVLKIIGWQNSAVGLGPENKSLDFLLVNS